MSPLESERRERYIASVMLAGSALSILGSLYMILCFVFLKSLRTFRHQLILGLAVGDLALALSFLVPSVSTLRGHKVSALGTQQSCAVNGFFIQFFFLQIDFWQLTIAVTTLLFLVWPSSTLDWARAHIYVLWLPPWVASLALALIAFGVWSFKPVGSFCWLEPAMARLFFDYLPRWLIIVACLAIYVFIFHLIRKIGAMAARERQYRIAAATNPYPAMEEMKEPMAVAVDVANADSMSNFSSSSSPSSSSDSLSAVSVASSGPIIFPRCVARDQAMANPEAVTTATMTEEPSTFGTPISNTSTVTTTTPAIAESLDEEETQRRQVKKIAMQLLTFPLANAVIWTIPTVVMVYEAIKGRDSVNMHVEGLAKMLLVLNGFVDAHVYGFNERTALGWRQRVRCGNPPEEIEIYEVPRTGPTASVPDSISMERDLERGA